MGMPADQFWSIIEFCRVSNGDAELQLAALRAHLASLAPGDLIGFHITYSQMVRAAYSWDLWGAAYVVHGGCSDDCFEYFCRWLVWQGREVYQAALSDPESLATAKVTLGPEEGWQFEEISYVAVDVWEAKGNEGDFYQHAKSDPYPTEPSGLPFEEDEAHLRQRYPKLWERFGEDPL